MSRYYPTAAAPTYVSAAAHVHRRVHDHRGSDGSAAGGGSVLPGHHYGFATASLTAVVEGDNPFTKVLTVPAGTPDGLYDVVVKARNAGQTLFVESAEHQQVVIDTTPPAIAAGALISPVGGEFWMFGVSHDIIWDATKITGYAPTWRPRSHSISRAMAAQASPT